MAWGLGCNLYEIHRLVWCRIGFVRPETGGHTKREGTWRNIISLHLISLFAKGNVIIQIPESVTFVIMNL